MRATCDVSLKLRRGALVVRDVREARRWCRAKDAWRFVSLSNVTRGRVLLPSSMVRSLASLDCSGDGTLCLVRKDTLCFSVDVVDVVVCR